MSDMKCPVCKTGNVEQGKYDKEYFCDNEFCPSYDETDSSTYNILIRTRKALDVAVDALKLMYQGNGDPQDIMRYIDNRWTPVRRLCKQTLEQITALEQKDVK